MRKKIYEFLVYDSKIRKKGTRFVEIEVKFNSKDDALKANDIFKKIEGIEKVIITDEKLLLVCDLAFVGKEMVEKTLKKNKIKFKSLEKREIKK